jgi:hypothetical protein
MALSAPIISVQDGSAAAAVNQANNATVFVTPGNPVTFALQSSTGVQQASMNITGIPGAPAPVGLTSPQLTAPGPFSWTVLFPPSPATCTLTVEVSDGFNASYASYTIVASQTKPIGIVHRARGVVTAAETLTAFDSVTGGTIRDGVTYVQGDVVLLVGQATKSQNGLYVVGVVAAGSAPLTRAVDFATGTLFDQSNRPVCELGPEGTLFGSTLWKMTTSGAITIDTTSHDWYPRQVTQSITLVAGTATIANVPILSATKTGVYGVRTTANTATLTTGGYGPVGAMTPGIVGTASCTFDAQVAAGTINNADISTLAVTIINF